MVRRALTRTQSVLACVSHGVVAPPLSLVRRLSSLPSPLSARGASLDSHDVVVVGDNSQNGLQAKALDAPNTIWWAIKHTCIKEFERKTADECKESWQTGEPQKPEP